MTIQDICTDIINFEIKKVLELEKKINDPKVKEMFQKSREKYIGNLDKNSQFRKNCNASYMNNKQCKGTLFEAGTNHEEIVRNVLKQNSKLISTSKEYKLLFEVFLSLRKNIFKDKSNVIVDGFYEKLTPKDIAQLRAHGATSGCTLVNPFHLFSKKTQKSMKRTFQPTIQRIFKRTRKSSTPQLSRKKRTPPRQSSRKKRTST